MYMYIHRNICSLIIELIPRRSGAKPTPPMQGCTRAFYRLSQRARGHHVRQPPMAKRPSASHQLKEDSHALYS